MSFTVTFLQHFHYDVTIKIMLAISKLQDAFLVTSHGYKGCYYGIAQWNDDVKLNI